MAVPKIAVIAIVAVIAVPILIGYALNLSEITITDYRSSGDDVNVTTMLENGTAYSYANADPVKLNLFNAGYRTTSSTDRYATIWPIYESYVYNKTAVFAKHHDTSAAGAVPGSTIALSNYHYLGVTITDVAYSSTDYLRLNISYVTAGGITVTTQVNNLVSWYYDDLTKTLEYSQYVDSGSHSLKTFQITSNTINLSYTKVGNYQGKYNDFYYYKPDSTNSSDYVDISSGFHFVGCLPDQMNYPWSVSLPDHTKSVLMTVNLDSITDSNYSCHIYISGSFGFDLIKTTTGGVVSWKLEYGSSPGQSLDLYYDPSRSDNTYQFNFDLQFNEYDGHYNHFTMNFESRYIGGWPKAIGEANSFITQNVKYDFVTSYPNLDYYFDAVSLRVSDASSRTPTIRIDDAYFRAFTYQVIEDQTYTPSSFKQNPITTINDPQIYGTSITFGGNTYIVNNGNINIAGHDVPVKGLTLSSVPSENGGYDNRIGKTVVSTTGTPSAITFNGQWSANISTKSMESYTYNKTEWHAGEFGWDGIDSNFLITGLVTCLGVFIGLGIYARRTQSGGLVPLMIVTGCAAAVFFIML